MACASDAVRASAPWGATRSATSVDRIINCFTVPENMQMGVSEAVLIGGSFKRKWLSTERKIRGSPSPVV